jgi:HEAT repeat protein
MKAAAVLAALLCLSPAAAQDEKAWIEAVNVFRTGSVSRDPVDRYQAIDELRKTSFDKVEKQYWLMVLGALRQEIAREGAGGKSEEKVSGEVLDSCLKAFRKISTPPVLAEMLKLAKSAHENVRVRAYVVWALGEKGDLKDFAELVEDKSPVVQIAAVDCLAERADASSLPLFFRLLSENRTWELKWSCLLALEKVADEKAIDPLIDSLGHCRTDEGRLKDQYIRILRKLLDSKLDSDDPNAWKAVWQAKKSGAEAAPGTTMADMTQFYGLKTRSTRLIFVLDKTGSMSDAGSEPEHPAYTLPTEATGVDKEPALEKVAREECAKIVKRWAGVTARTRIDVAKKELISTLYVLSPKVHFNILWYEALPSPWKQELVPATWPNKLEAMTATDKVIASGGTNIWDALELAFKMIEVPTKTGANPVVLDRKVNYASATGGADTFFLMTDGRPTVGKLVGTDEVIAELKKVNRLRKVTIHTICVGDRAPGSAIVDGPDPAFLKRIADQNNGDFVHIRR